MKKILALLMIAAMIFAFAACNQDEKIDETPDTDNVTDNVESTDDTEEATEEATDKIDASKVMVYSEFVAAELESEVCVETYIQAKQGWWEKDGVGVATFYTQNEAGGYYLYEMPCSKEDYDNKLVKGTKIRVNGYKAEWSGEVEIIDATYEIIEGEYIAEAKDLTDKLGTDELKNYLTQYALFKGLTVEKVEYQNGEPGKDIYVTFGYNGASYDFCVESYLVGPDTDVYKAVGALEVGTVVDVEGFVYWYEGLNPHITNVIVAE